MFPVEGQEGSGSYTGDLAEDLGVEGPFQGPRGLPTGQAQLAGPGPVSPQGNLNNSGGIHHL